MNSFDKLSIINVNDKIEKKEGLSYLTWSFAWAELKKVYPEATYIIKKFGDNQLPYVYDNNTGYMVFTEVTIENITYEMWLPVMDSKNKAMKNVQYDYTTKYGVKSVEPATMFDINKTIMRCLVKNLAMFGLGLYIYAGEDLPEGEEDPKDKLVTDKEVKNLVSALKTQVNIDGILKKYNKTKLEEFLISEYVSAIHYIEELKKKAQESAKGVL